MTKCDAVCEFRMYVFVVDLFDFIFVLNDSEGKLIDFLKQFQIH